MADETLTALDASFLAAERPGFPLHIGGVAVFDGGHLVDDAGRLDIEQVRRLVLGHLDRLPRFRRKILPAPFGLRMPQWVDAPQFDVRDHVLLVHLDSPGSDEQLFAQAAELQQRPIDRSKPLWEMWF